LFEKAPKLSRILSYICGKYFEGNAENLKQYNIAVEALERAPGFDPQADAIVRVDLHLLRKRLRQYYAGAGKGHEVQIVLPAGQYAPQFIHRRPESAETQAAETTSGSASGNDSAPPATASLTESLLEAEEETDTPGAAGLRESVQRLTDVLLANLPLTAVICWTVGLVMGLSSVLLLSRDAKSAIRIVTRAPRAFESATAAFLTGFSFGGAPDAEIKGIRILCGGQHDFIDSSGFRWQADRYFTGGTAFHRSNQPIRGFPDSSIFANGRQGVFWYEIPVPPGVYEVHLLFAETTPGTREGMRSTIFAIGAGGNETLDVVSDAGGTETATMKVYPDVRPAADRKIHIRFSSENGFLNALEILPDPDQRPNPIRISSLPNLYTDPAGRHWLSDRYFTGGRDISHSFPPNRSDPPLLTRERYGNFSYTIPVAKGYSYALTLYMAERYWGSRNSGLGGTGSRIFDVRCNGMELLHNFDLIGEQKTSRALAVRFRQLRPDVRGKLKIDFLPVIDYAVLNALEVEPE